MEAIESLLEPVSRLLNKNIRESTPARELCRRLAGKRVAVRVAGSGLAAQLAIDADGVVLSSTIAGEPDVVIAGLAPTLLRLAAGDDGDGRDDGLSITGDAEVAEDFRRLLRFARPDLEEELAQVVGDVVAFRLGELARGFGRWRRNAAAVMRDNVREYLQEESRDVPTRDEVRRFAADVDALRDDVERVAARLSRLQGGT